MRSLGVTGRIPAGFNGCVGLKATVGRVSTTGVVPACSSLDCLTCFATNVRDAATVIQVMQVCSAALQCPVLCCAVLCRAVLWCCVLCCAVLCIGLLCCAVLCCAVLCSAVLWFGVVCCAVLCSGLVCCAVLCCAVLRCAVLRCYNILQVQHAGGRNPRGP